MSIAALRSELFQALACEVHVWCLHTPTTLPPHCEQLLGPGENLRWRRCCQPAHRNRFLIGKTLQRMVLSAYLPIASSSWMFVQKPLGRPEVGGPSAGRRLRFSLSHTLLGLPSVFNSVGSHGARSTSVVLEANWLVNGLRRRREEVPRPGEW